MPRDQMMKQCRAILHQLIFPQQQIISIICTTPLSPNRSYQSMDIVLTLFSTTSIDCWRFWCFYFLLITIPHGTSHLCTALRDRTQPVRSQYSVDVYQTLAGPSIHTPWGATKTNKLYWEHATFDYRLQDSLTQQITKPTDCATHSNSFKSHNKQTTTCNGFETVRPKLPCCLLDNKVSNVTTSDSCTLPTTQRETDTVMRTNIEFSTQAVTINEVLIRLPMGRMLDQWVCSATKTCLTVPPFCQSSYLVQISDIIMLRIFLTARSFLFMAIEAN